jgi:acyl-CoA hydrolase
MATIADRIENPELLAKVVPVEEAVKQVTGHCTLAVSGFTRSGEPKTFLPALADYLAKNAPQTRVALFSGASLSEEVEGPIAPFLSKRGPYMSSAASRKLIHTGTTDFTDVHLSQFGKNIMYGFYGDVDLAVVEVSRIRPDGSVVLSSSVGISTEALAKAKKVILEVNTVIPDYTGFHDIALPATPPLVGWPLPITNVSDRIGTPYIEFDLRKVVAVIESTVPDHPVPFRPTEEIDRKIAANVIEFLLYCRKCIAQIDDQNDL